MKKDTQPSNIQEDTQLLWLRHFAAGICAGIVSRTCTAPVDRLRTFFQGSERTHFMVEDRIFALF